MDDFSRDELEQLMAVFRDQAESMLDEMAQDLLLLEAEDNDPQAMAGLRRAAHTIKGDSACIGLDGIGELAHSLEDVLSAASKGELKLEPTVIDVLLEALDHVRNAINGDEVVDISDRVLPELLANLSALRGSNPEGVEQGRASSPGVPLRDDEIGPGQGPGERQDIPSVSPDEGRAGIAPAGTAAGAAAPRKRRGPEYVRVEATRIDALM